MFNENQTQEVIDLAIKRATELYLEKKYDYVQIILEQLLEINPDNNQALQMMGSIFYYTKNFPQAQKYFQKALDYDDKNTENHNNMALFYSETGNFLKAIEHFERAIVFSPQCYYLYSNLALQYRNCERMSEAIQYLEKSLACQERADTWCMLGCCYGEQNIFDKAEECFNKSLSLDPNLANAHCNLALIHFNKGRWMDGWKEYEWRLENFPQIKVWLEKFDINKRWKGENLKNKRIFLHSEQGVGDSIHFFRYASLLKEMGAYVIVHCPIELESLYAPHVNEVYTDDPYSIPNERTPAYDYFASLMSLPYLLNNPPIPQTPYLFTNKEINLGSEYSDYFKVGIVWAGNPQHPNDRYRSCALKLFETIHDLPKVKLFSLQKDVRPRQYRFSEHPIDLTADCEHLKIVNLAEMINTFEDTAALLKQLDLLISVDTSVVHLAGAIGTPTWLLLPYNNDWRWKLSGTTTEWYDSVRLFRQPKLGDWSSVFKEITCLLKEKYVK